MHYEYSVAAIEGGDEAVGDGGIGVSQQDVGNSNSVWRQGGVSVGDMGISLAVVDYESTNRHLAYINAAKTN